MLELMKVLSVYIQMLSGMQALTEENMPAVHQMSVCSMQQLFTGSDVPCDLSGPHVGAVYNRNQNVIILPDGTDINNWVDVSALVHELVHAQQQNDQRMFAATCIERELQAYRIQMKWIADVAKKDPHILIDSAEAGAILSCAGKEGL